MPTAADAQKDQVRLLVVGPIQTNCYAYVSQGECLVVDPGSVGDLVARELEDVRVTKVVVTHGHTDHIAGVAALKEATGAVFLISAADAHRVDQVEGDEGFIDSERGDRNAPEPDALLREGDSVGVGTARFRVMETPGHTEGCIVLVGEGSAEGVAFVGDTLFAGGAGRTDLPGGDFTRLMESLDRLGRELAPETTVLSGHGPTTTMSRELSSNDFLRAAMDGYR